MRKFSNQVPLRINFAFDPTFLRTIYPDQQKEDMQLFRTKGLSHYSSHKKIFHNKVIDTQIKNLSKQPIKKYKKDHQGINDINFRTRSLQKLKSKNQQFIQSVLKQNSNKKLRQAIRKKLFSLTLTKKQQDQISKILTQKVDISKLNQKLILQINN